MMIPFALARPFLFSLDPERAHQVTLAALKLGLGGSGKAVSAPVTVGGVRFENPVGLAAGFDKDGEAIDPLLKAGFGFVEIGGVTPKPQPGNDRPRVFRLTEDSAVINRYGLNSRGVDHVARNLQARTGSGTVGVNLGANKESDDRTGDYAECLKTLQGLVDFATVNVSSPNTPGLRALQDRAALTDIFDRLHAVQSSGPTTPLFLKIAPDLSDEDVAAIADAAPDIGVAALVVANTTVARPNSLQSRHAPEAGGLSGAPLMQASTDLLRRFRARLQGRVALIGVGGIMSGADAKAKMDAGAAAVQIYSGLVYRGPGLIRECALAAAGQ
jgi:dihydroorotate dehydrogenase